MSAKHFFILSVILVAVVAVAGCTQSASEPAANETPEIVMTNPVPPVPVESTGGVNIAYELELNGLEEQEFIPVSIDIIDAATGEVIYTPDEAVFSATYQPASNPPPTEEEITEGTLKLAVPRISIWFKVNNDSVPDKLVHRLTLKSVSGDSPVTITGGEVTVQKDLKSVVIGPPMHGSGWVIMETTEPTTHHFLMPVMVNGVTTVDQRYAADYFLMDPETKETVRGNTSDAKNYLGYGKELLAVADGTVVSVLDGIPDNEVPFVLPAFNFSTGTGNSVIIDIGNEKYACYCHMIPGSITVKEGDVVSEGDVIGLLGNSGQSDIPHLHFEVVTGKPAIMGGEGYPYVFRSFDLLGSLNITMVEEASLDPAFDSSLFFADFGDYVEMLTEPVPEQDKLVENWAIVAFP